MNTAAAIIPANDPAWLALARRVQTALAATAPAADVPAILSDPKRLASALAESPDLADALNDPLIRRGVASLITA